MNRRVRAALPDRPGMLAQIATACGEADVNILSFQAFREENQVIDEFVVSTNDTMSDVALADIFIAAGGTAVTVTRVDDEGADVPLRYLEAMHELFERARDISEVLRDLLDTTAPDVADYAGHDVLDLVRRDGSHLHIRRAVPFTAIERKRAQAILSLMSDAGLDIPPLEPPHGYPTPVVRLATLADIEGVAALHARSSVQTLYNRYQVPLRLPMTTRMARRLVVPDQGRALVVQVGNDLVGHGLLELVEERWVFHLIVEDAWQGRGLGSLLIAQAAGRAKALGAEKLTLISADTNDRLLRAVGRAGFVARVERQVASIFITIPLRTTSAIND